MSNNNNPETVNFLTPGSVLESVTKKRSSIERLINIKIKHSTLLLIVHVSITELTIIDVQEKG